MSAKHFKTIALIMAAGKGLRVGNSLPKQYLSFKGRLILEQSITAFLHHPVVDAVRVVIGAGDEELYAQAIVSLQSPKLLPPVLGGEERCDSVRLGLEGLEEFSPKYVLIHDGARPFVSHALITRVREALEYHKGVIPGVAVVDTLKRAPQNVIEATIDRTDIYYVQTPQGFDFPTILKAHRKLQNVPGLTDDARLLEHLHIPVQIVAGDPKNKKITTPEDLKGDEMTVPDIRVGHGIDVHAIGTGEGVTILGVFIRSGFSLIGHSDADVGLHSLVDALLGTIGDGDIGQHFNPKDDRWKGMDSSVFLKEVVRRVRDHGGKISHVDVTIIGERPKIAPHREKMSARIAEILDIEVSRVSVKATTTEKLGFVGREEGLAAFATATVVF